MKVCGICGHKFSACDSTLFCPGCVTNYELFCQNLPDGWKRLTLGRKPTFDEWLSEQRIIKNLENGKIAQEEANRQTAELSEQIRKKYNPTPEERAERDRIVRAHYAKKPSLFG